MKNCCDLFGECSDLFVCVFLFVFFSSRLNVVKNWSGLFRDPRYPSTSLSISKAARVGMENLRYPRNDDDNRGMVVVMIEVKILAKPRRAGGVFCVDLAVCQKITKTAKILPNGLKVVSLTVCILWKTKYMTIYDTVRHFVTLRDMVSHNVRWCHTM